MDRSRRAALLAWPLFFAFSALASAQPVRAGADFQLNAYTTGGQRVPRVAMLRDGGFVTVWHSDGQDGSSYGIFGRRYDGSGAPLGAEFQANTYTTGRQYGPLVSSDRKGNFVVVWESDGQDGNAYGVFAQRYYPSGARNGGEFQVNTFTTGYQFASDAAHDAAGNFVVVWTGTDQDGDLASVHGQRFGAAGNHLGAEFQINIATTGSQVAPSIGMEPSGSFVVVWVTPDGSSYGIGGQRFDANGARVGGEFRVNAATTGDQRSAQVRMAESGAFVVTWRENDGAGFGAFGQRFDAAANPVGGRFQVNAYTTGNQISASMAMDALGNFVVTWLGPPMGLAGRRFRADGTPRDPDFAVSGYTTGAPNTTAVVADDVGNIVAVWSDNGRDGDQQGAFAQRFGGLRPSALAVDPTGNNVLQPGETAQLRPAWTNRNGAAQAFAATLSGFTGPAGGTYTLLDGAADYGTVPDGATATCTDCYFVSVAAANRPALHWDASVIESLTPDGQGQQKRWLLHVGDSFNDVPISSPFYRFIETLLHNEVTGGCGADIYCPGSATTRQQMAVFTLVGRERTSYVPPACVPPNLFADVPETSPFCRWIEELANRGVVGGCGGGNYCPAALVTREQMAIFMLRTLDPALSPPACTPPNIYADVPETSAFCRWIEELTSRGVVGGCGNGNYCPTAGVTREQMGVFITVTFGLTLYGP